MKLSRILALGLASVAASLVFAMGYAATAQAQYGGTQGFIIDPAEGFPGDTVNLLGTGCGANTTVVFTILQNGQIIATTSANADPDGTFFVEGVVIPDIPAGTYDIEARCGTRSMVAQMTVLARSRPPGPLAFTGANSVPLIRVGVILLAGGALALFGVRRRRQIEPASS